jgi:hypothetical protein
MSGPRVINREEIDKIFQETAQGDFAARWMTEWQLGMFHLYRMRRTGAKSMMEQVGRECCMMELDPKYVDVITHRFIEQTGSDNNVFLLSNGEKIPYSEVMKLNYGDTKTTRI